MNADWKEGESYAYDEVYKSLKGGSHGHYLPCQGKTVFAAFLSIELNPEAPRVVLVGKGTAIQRAGQILVDQDAPIPVFIKEKTNQWRYEGLFHSVRRLDQATSDEMANAAERSDVAFAVELEKVGEAFSQLPVYFEGACSQVTRNAYERSLEARSLCLKHYGQNCYVCMMSFGEEYGTRGLGFIHVHHLSLISKKGATSPTDPINDLRPVCPNCHAMLHSGPLMTPEDLKAIYWSEDSVTARQKRTLKP